MKNPNQIEEWDDERESCLRPRLLEGMIETERRHATRTGWATLGYVGGDDGLCHCAQCEIVRLRRAGGYPDRLHAEQPK